MFAKAFHRIHRRNLINNGIVPVIIGEDLHGKAAIGQEWSLPNLRDEIQRRSPAITVRVDGAEFAGRAEFTEYERDVLLGGGLLRYLKSKR